MTTIVCPECGFPIATRGREGEPVSCPMCGATGTVSRVGQFAIIGIPAPLFAGVLGFFFGAVFGPVVKEGLEKLGRAK